MKQPTAFVSTLDTFRHLAQSELPDWHLIAPATQTIQLSKGEPLFVIGQKKPFAFVLTQGILKLVYETPRGDYWVNAFLLPGTCFASLAALKPGGVTSFSAYAVQDAQVDQVDFDMLEKMADRHIEWQRGMGAVMRYYARAKELREMELLTLSPEDRYLSFIRLYGPLMRHLTQKDIASYVRVTPVALSRIKKRLLAEQKMPSSAPPGTPLPIEHHWPN